MKKRYIASIIMTFSIFTLLISTGCDRNESISYESNGNACEDQNGNKIKGSITVGLTGAVAYERQKVIFFIYAEGFTEDISEYGIEGGGTFTITGGEGQSVTHDIDTDEPIIFDRCSYDILIWIDSNNDEWPTVGEMIAIKSQIDFSQNPSRTITLNITELVPMPAGKR